MEIATPTERPAPADGPASPLAGAEHRGALLRYATRLMEKAAEHAAPTVDAALRQAAGPDTPAPATEGEGEDGAAEETAAAPGAEDAQVERLFAFVRRHALARMRREGVAQRTATADGDEPAATLPQRVERLTPKQREVVWLKFSHGFGYEALSRIIGLSVRNVGFLVHSALTNLREAAAGGRVTAAEDARVTDYALDEMNAGQRAAFEDSLRRDAAVKLALGEVRALVAELDATFGNNEETTRRAKKRRRRAGGAWWRAGWFRAAVLGTAVAAGGVWWYLREPAAVSRKADTEVFQMKPDVWKLAKARAEREAREGRTGVGAGAQPSGGSDAARNDKPDTDRGPNHAPEKEPKPDGPDAGGKGDAQNGAAIEHAAKARAENLKAKPLDDDGGVTPAPDGDGAVGAGGGGAEPTAVSAMKGPGKGASPAAVRDGAGAGKPGSGGTGSVEGGGGGLGNLSEGTGGGGRGPGTLAGSAPGAKPAAGSTKGAPGAKSAAATSGRESGAAREGGAAISASALRTPEAEPVGASPLREALATKRWPSMKAAGLRALLNAFPGEPAVVPTAPGVNVAVEVADAPWEPERKLVRVVLSAPPARSTRAAGANVVLLLDISSSMDAPNRLPLVQAAARRMLHDLRPEDRVAIVTYAGEARLRLPSTPVARAAEIRSAIGALRPEGQTNGGAGLRRAYEVARAAAVPGGVNRVVLCTDGDFNMGLTSEAELAALVEREARAGVTLAVFGFGRGRRIDPRLEALAAKGRGGSGNVNTRREAERRLAGEVNGFVPAAARELRLDFDCDPARVAVCRLVGYDENFLPPEAEDRGRVEVPELAPGETVTALFEVVPAEARAGTVEPDRPWLTVRASYTENGWERTQRVAVKEPGVRFPEASAEFRFSASVAGLGLALRESPPSPARLAAVVQWTETAVAESGARDPGGFRDEFVALAREARELAAAK